jgi:radical SAM PhpK family P-methyltransferase
MVDCIVVGYHESEVASEELAEDLFETTSDIPAPIRGILRSRLRIDGQLHFYLDALSYLRHKSNIKGELKDSAYDVAEVPNLGTLYLVNYLRKRGHSADFVNCFTHEGDKLAQLLAEGPLAVAITTTFYMLPAPVIDIVRFIRMHNRETKIIVGGPLIDNYGRALELPRLSGVFDRMGADLYIWDSQGESTLNEVIRAIKGRRSLSDISNVFTRSGSSWSFGGKKPESNNLNECSVDWTGFDRTELGTTVSTRTARSCAFSCAFCDYPARAGALVFADVATVERELEQLVGMGVRNVAFIDDTFNVPVLRFKELCRMMVRRAFGLEWFSYFRCGEAKEEGIYDLMADAGCKGLLLGIESGDDRILKNMDKRGTTASYRYGISQLKKRGIFTHASTVVGFPGETEESIQNTIDFLNETGPDTFTVNHWYYSHVTPIHRRAAECGLTGEGFNWSHTTMNSRQAMDAADRMFHEITTPAWMPVSGLDFWGVPYLMGKEMTTKQILTFLRLAKGTTPLGMRQGIGNVPGQSELSTFEREPANQLARFCESLSLAEARYQKSWERA